MTLILTVAMLWPLEAPPPAPDGSDIIKRGVVKVKSCERPSDREVSWHSLRVGATQDLLIKGYDLAAIMRSGG